MVRVAPNWVRTLRVCEIRAEGDEGDFYLGGNGVEKRGVEFEIIL